MRWIFTSLALANIAILIYFLFVDNHRVHGGPPINNHARGNLVLLSEREHTLRRRQPSTIKTLSPTKTLSASKTDSLSNADEALCTLIGPFASLLRAEYLTERLAALGAAANIKELTVSIGLNYWVYLTPEISRKKALRRLAELQQKSIDSYIIPTGDLANGISLGIYTNKERAVAMRDRIAENGYAPEIMEVPRQRQQTWVFLTADQTSAIDEQTWLSLLASEQAIEKRRNRCAELLI